jgi:hypothetical protein
MGNLTLGSIDDSNDDEDMKNASAAILMMSNNVKALRTARFELAERVDALHLYFSPFSIFVHLSLRFIVCKYGLCSQKQHMESLKSQLKTSQSNPKARKQS